MGAHGVKGEVKVRSSTDFVVTRLCTPGVKHVKAPNRRFPRELVLLGGRLHSEDIFLLHFEVGLSVDLSRLPCLGCPHRWTSLDLASTIFPLVSVRVGFI